MTFLSESRKIRLPEYAGRFDPWEAFGNYADLFTDRRFVDHLTEAGRLIDEVPEVSISAFDIIKQATDDQIWDELPEGHVFDDFAEFCTIIKRLLICQPDGVEGDLLANGYVTNAYVRVSGSIFTIFAAWHSRDKRWAIYDDPCHAKRWVAGHRVLSRN